MQRKPGDRTIGRLHVPPAVIHPVQRAPGASRPGGTPHPTPKIGRCPLSLPPAAPLWPPGFLKSVLRWMKREGARELRLSLKAPRFRARLNHLQRRGLASRNGNFISRASGIETIEIAHLSRDTGMLRTSPFGTTRVWCRTLESSL